MLLRYFMLLGWSALIIFNRAEALEPARSADELLQNELILVVAKVSGPIHCDEMQVSNDVCSRHIKTLEKYNSSGIKENYLVAGSLRGKFPVFSRIELNKSVDIPTGVSLIGRKYLVFPTGSSDSDFFVHPCEVVELSEEDVKVLLHTNADVSTWVNNNLERLGCRQVVEVFESEK